MKEKSHPFRTVVVVLLIIAFFSLLVFGIISDNIRDLVSVVEVMVPVAIVTFVAWVVWDHRWYTPMINYHKEMVDEYPFRVSFWTRFLVPFFEKLSIAMGVTWVALWAFTHFGAPIIDLF